MTGTFQKIQLHNYFEFPVTKTLNVSAILWLHVHSHIRQRLTIDPVTAQSTPATYRLIHTYLDRGRLDFLNKIEWIHKFFDKHPYILPICNYLPSSLFMMNEPYVFENGIKITMRCSYVCTKFWWLLKLWNDIMFNNNQNDTNLNCAPNIRMWKNSMN